MRHFFALGLHRGLHAESVDDAASDPFLRYLEGAPIDDEAVTPEEATAIAEVEADRLAGTPRVPFEQVKRLYR